MGPEPYIIQRGSTLLGRVQRLVPGSASDWLTGELKPASDRAASAPLFAAEYAALQHADRWPEAYAVAQGPGISIIDADDNCWGADVHVAGLRRSLQLR